MKKYIIIAAIFLGAGVLTSCTKQGNSKTTTAFFAGLNSAKKDIGSAD